MRWLAPVVVILVTFLAFQPAVNSAFLNLDDQVGIELNQRYRGLSGEHLKWMFSTGRMGHYQPLSWISLGVDHRLWGMDSRGYHLTNVVLHVLGAWLTYFLARRVLRLTAADRVEPKGSRASVERLAAAVAALAFAVHPLRVESVAWVTERRDVLSLVFFLLALLAWLRAAPETRPLGVRPGLAIAALAAGMGGLALLAASLDLRGDDGLALRGPGAVGLVGAAVLVFAVGPLVRRALRWEGRAASGTWISIALACLLASLFAKAWGVVVPALLLVIDVWPLRRLGPEQAGRGARAAALIFEKLPFAVLVLPFVALATWAQATLNQTMLSWAEHSLHERLAQSCYGLAFYPWKTLVPIGLIPFHNLPDELSLRQARFAVPAIAVVLVTTGLVLLRRRWPAGLVAWLLFALMIFPVLGWMQSGPQLVAERYSYFSCLPFALLVGGGVVAAHRRGGIGRWLVPVSVAVWIFGLTGLTFRQARNWQSSEALWVHTLRVEPGQPDACLGLAVIRRDEALRTGDVERRRELLLEALELLEQGRAARQDARFDSQLAQVHMNLAELPGIDPAQRQGHVESAVQCSRSALEIGKSSGQGILAPYYLIYGQSLLAAGEPAKALEPLQIFVRAKPARAAGHAALGEALLAMGRSREAADELTRAVEIEPAMARSWILLGRAWEQAGDPVRAVETYRQALIRSPGEPEATRRLQALGAR